MALRIVAPFLTNRWTWAAGTVVTSLIMTSGYMFTRIRGTPYSGANGQWIAPGYQNQFGQETQVVALICTSQYFDFRLDLSQRILVDALLAMSFLMLILVTPLQPSPQRQRAQIYLWTAIIMVIYSILVSFFRLKNKGASTLLQTYLVVIAYKCCRVSLQAVLLGQCITAVVVHPLMKSDIIAPMSSARACFGNALVLAWSLYRLSK